MELLEAVNTVMPYLGEHVVTDVDTTKHPTVDLILMGLERNRKALLSEGWWFNDVIKVPLQPDTSGHVPAPRDSLSVYGYEKEVVVDGQFLFNLTDNTTVFDSSVNVRYTKDIEFQDLPYYAACTVLYKTAMEVYTADLGIDANFQLIQTLYEENRRKLVQDNLRNRGYNTTRPIGGRFRGFIRRH